MSTVVSANFRLSEEAVSILNQLAARDFISMTAVLEILIRERARSLGIEPKPKESNEKT